MAATSEPVRLRAGPLELELVPAIGGSVASFRVDGIDLFRPLSASDRAAGNVLGVGMFPMLPYANRIAGNAFDFGGRTHRFAANNPPERFNVHGTGWHRPWQAEAFGPGEALLSLEVRGAGEPYAYRATQRFRLRDDAFDVTIGITNLAEWPMPFGFGLHPWFERDADVTLGFAASRFYLEEPEGVSGEPISIPPELDHREPRPLPSGWRNNDYGGWEGRAELTFPSRGVRLTMEAEPVFRHLMLYADPTRPYFCVEPQTNASCAFNRTGGFADPEEGVIVLRPGQSASGKVSFGVTRL